ncbi:MAG TPA: FAD-dependent monooxygenase [Streptosporangiaceae bacterium]|nr:FAD-dependent monooxygenase [Streptosporangiaceae bacterium]
MGDSAGTAVPIIGAGLSGLFAAVELARHGVRARVIEREPRPHHPDLASLSRRWQGIVDVSPGSGDPRLVGLAGEGAVLIRPDGYIGFRAVPADRAGLSALDGHLRSYLVPEPA